MANRDSKDASRRLSTKDLTGGAASVGSWITEISVAGLQELTLRSRLEASFMAVAI
jgi:hypothetical protein